MAGGGARPSEEFDDDERERGGDHLAGRPAQSVRHTHERGTPDRPGYAPDRRGRAQALVRTQRESDGESLLDSGGLLNTAHFGFPQVPPLPPLQPLIGNAPVPHPVQFFNLVTERLEYPVDLPVLSLMDDDAHDQVLALWKNVQFRGSGFPFGEANPLRKPPDVLGLDRLGEI